MTYASPKRSKPVAPAPRGSVKGTFRGAPYRVGSPSFIGSAPRLGAASSPLTPVVHTKLEVGPPNDRFEKEADRVADQVLRGASVGPLSPIPTHPQRKCTACEAEEKETVRRQADEDEEELQLKRDTSGPQSADADAAEAAIAQGGRPLSPAERTYFEPRFGFDFSNVRIHDEPRAHSAAESIDARAFTLDTDIAFGRGEYEPTTSPGRRLLAHELAHVVQQSSDRVRLVRRQPREEAAEAVEQEAQYLKQLGEAAALEFVRSLMAVCSQFPASVCPNPDWPSCFCSPVPLSRAEILAFRDLVALYTLPGIAVKVSSRVVPLWER
jgi:hypothetical protein